MTGSETTSKSQEVTLLIGSLMDIFNFRIWDWISFDIKTFFAIWSSLTSISVGYDCFDILTWDIYFSAWLPWCCTIQISKPKYMLSWTWLPMGERLLTSMTKYVNFWQPHSLLTLCAKFLEHLYFQFCSIKKFRILLLSESNIEILPRKSESTDLHHVLQVSSFSIFSNIFYNFLSKLWIFSNLWNIIINLWKWYN